MDLLNKTQCLLLLGFLMVEIFPQEKSYISTNGNISNSFHKKSIYNISTFTPSKKNNSAWVLDSLIYIRTNGNRNRIAYYYNDDLSLNYFINADWYNGQWIDFDKHTNTYNSEGKLISVLWEIFNSTTKEWRQTEKDVYNYDSLGNRDFHLHLDFNGQEFENDFKYESSYDSANNLVSSVNQDWIDSIWINSSKLINTYTSDNLKDSALFQKWINNQWVNSQLGNFEYDENHNMIAILTKTLQEQQWINYALGLFDYDENNNLVLENFQKIVYNNWENWFRIFYEYDDNNNLIHLFGEEWENGQWVPENEPLKVTNPDGILFGYVAKEIFLNYSKPTSVGSEKNIVDRFNLLQNYSNPFNLTTTINYSIKERGFVQLKVFDVLGKEIVTLVNEEKQQGNYSVFFTGSNLPSGVYVYSIRVNSFIQNRKMILLK